MDEIKDMELFDQLDALSDAAVEAGAAPSDYCRINLSKTDITDSPGRPWTYQYCTEFGFFQTPSEEHPMRSVDLLSMPYWNTYCE